MGGSERFIIADCQLKIDNFRKVIALVLCIGALPIVFNASAHAEEAVSQVTPASAVSYLWDEYKKPVKLTYGAQAKIQTTYLWRGLYAGGPNLQASANVGYGGLYVDLWWNIGTFDWRFNSFEPEVDLTLGFDRWGLNALVLFIHNFNCPFFDFSNDPYKGNRLEVDVSYTLSPKIPLKILWASRVAAADSYVNDAGDTIRAFSSYLELSYNHHFPYGISLYGAVGMTPWKSVYTHYVHNAGVVNVEVRLRKDWSLSERCGMMLQGQVTINPTMLAADHRSAQWQPYTPYAQTVNANLTVGVYLK